MKVVYTEEALKDLDAIADWLIHHYQKVKGALRAVPTVLPLYAQFGGLASLRPPYLCCISRYLLQSSKP